MKKILVLLITYTMFSGSGNVLGAGTARSPADDGIQQTASHQGERRSSKIENSLAQTELTLVAQLSQALPVDTEYVPATALRKHGKPRNLFLRSHIALLYDERDGEIIINRSANKKVPIASVTKLMTAMVVIDANLPMHEPIKIVKADKDRLRYSKSRLQFGTTLTRSDLLLLALVASENRAAAALARTYPGGRKAFVAAMNKKAKSLNLHKTTFADAAGLRNENISTAKELVQLVNAASQYPLIRQLTTTQEDSVTDTVTQRTIKFLNTNRLVRKDNWQISLSKTGFTSEAGNCLVMKTKIAERPLIMILLNSWGKLSKYGDSNRIKKWLIKTENSIRRLKL